MKTPILYVLFHIFILLYNILLILINDINRIYPNRKKHPSIQGEKSEK